MEFTYTATLAISDEEEANDVWKAAEYLQMQEALKALNNKWGNIDTHPPQSPTCFFLWLEESVMAAGLSCFFLAE